jgi:Rod binding domain-containing protein
MAASLSLAPNNGVGGIGSGALDAAHAAAAANAARAISAAGTAKFGAHAKARAVSQDFEAMFLNSMFGFMFAGIKGEGPVGGNGAVGIWRSFLVDQFAKSYAKAGGIGIADMVYRSLITHQEATSK